MPVCTPPISVQYLQMEKYHAIRYRLARSSVAISTPCHAISTKGPDARGLGLEGGSRGSTDAWPAPVDSSITALHACGPGADAMQSIVLAQVCGQPPSHERVGFGTRWRAYGLMPTSFGSSALRQRPPQATERHPTRVSSPASIAPRGTTGASLGRCGCSHHDAGRECGSLWALWGHF